MSADAEEPSGTAVDLDALDAPLPPSVAGRLRAARREAVTGRAARRARRHVLRGAAATAFGATGAALLLRDASPPIDGDVPADVAALPAVDARDWALLASAEAPEFYDDLELLLWLEEEGLLDANG